MPVDEHESGNQGPVGRFVRGAIPIAIVCFLLLGFAPSPNGSPASVVILLAICAIVLWFGWSYIRGNPVTKWLGIVVAAFLGLMLGLFAIGVALRVGLVLFPLALLALPFVIYDLLFRAPLKGRLDRGGSEQDHLGVR